MYTIQAFKVGESGVPGPEIYYQGAFGKWFPLFFYVWLVQGEGRTILVDTGMPADASELETRVKREKGPEAYWRTEPGGHPVKLLAGVGVSPEQVEHVILSSLGPYAAANVHSFPRALVHLSKAGWLEYLAPQYPEIRHKIPDEAMAHLTTTGLERVRLVHREAEIAPGIRAWEVGCHHRHSMAIAIETRKGTAVIADPIFYYDNVEKDVPLGILENLFECLDLIRRLRREAAILLPSHDPAVLVRHPGGRIP
jgi:glyoxylase-like metal-dependent hydrolase (beta-lactamase superfamily II)